MDQMTTGDAGGIFAGIVAFVVAIGGGIRWVIGWKDGRQDMRERKLEAWEESLRQREKAQRIETEKRLRGVEVALVAMRQALLDVTDELRQHAPASAALVSAEAALRQAFPVSWDTPPDMADLAARIEAGHD